MNTICTISYRTICTSYDTYCTISYGIVCTYHTMYRVHFFPSRIRCCHVCFTCHCDIFQQDWPACALQSFLLFSLLAEILSVGIPTDVLTCHASRRYHHVFFVFACTIHRESYSLLLPLVERLPSVFTCTHATKDELNLDQIVILLRYYYLAPFLTEVLSICVYTCTHKLKERHVDTTEYTM